MDVVLLTQSDCAFCDDAKQMLERLSGEYRYSLKYVELTSPKGQKMAEQGGVLFPPGIFIDGIAFWYGRLSERKFRKELERRASH